MTAIKHTPEIEAYLDALDHLDSVHDLLQNVNAQISDQIHAVREQAKVEAGFLLAQEARRAKNGSSTPADP